jgi:molecular chaperone DnaK
MNTSEPTLCIDFGTSTSSMAWLNPATQRAEIIKSSEGHEQTPSVVYFGEGEPVVGDSALLMLEDQDECKRVILSAKRELANDGILPVPGRRLKALDVAAAILKKLKTDAERFHFHESVKRAVITCPAAFDSLEQERVHKAGILAGFEDVTLIEEPVAAALAYAREGLQVGKYILVYDLGGGTFDLAVLAHEDGAFRLAFEPLGIRRCGGDDFDWALYDHFDALAQERLGRSFGQSSVDPHVLWSCRRIKESLTCLAQSSLSVYLDGIQFKEVIMRTAFETLIRERIETTVRLTREVLATAQQRCQTVDTVVLIGGSSRIPLILSQLREALPFPPQEWQHQDIAVALGAAYHSLQKPVPKPIPPKEIPVEPLLKTEISREDPIAQHENPKIPEDSVLRRHYFANLNAKVESNMPVRPTDSVLRRHYDNLLANNYITDTLTNCADASSHSHVPRRKNVPVTVNCQLNPQFFPNGIKIYIDTKYVGTVMNNGRDVICEVSLGRHRIQLRSGLEWMILGGQSNTIEFDVQPETRPRFEIVLEGSMWKGWAIQQK